MVVMMHSLNICSVCTCVCIHFICCMSPPPPLSPASDVWESQLLQVGGDSVWTGHLQLSHH